MGTRRWNKHNTNEDVVDTKFLVEGLPLSFCDQDLNNLFAPFGTVLSASIIRNLKGQSLCMGEVEMSTPQDAQNAKQTLHKSVLGGTLLLVFEKKGNRRPNS